MNVELSTFEEVSEIVGDLMLIMALSLSSVTTKAFVAKNAAMDFSQFTVFDVIPPLMVFYVALRTVIYLERGDVLARIGGWVKSIRGETV